MTFAAGWVLQKRGADILAQWRGRYRTALGASRILKSVGGMIALVDLGAAAIGIERTVAAKRGDIAIVQAPEGEMGAIVTGPGSATFSGSGGGGLFVRALPILAAWSI